MAEEKLPQSSRIEIGAGIVLAALQFWFPNLPVIGSILFPIGVLVIIHGACPQIIKRSFWTGFKCLCAYLVVLCIGSVWLIIHVAKVSVSTREATIATITAPAATVTLVLPTPTPTPSPPPPINLVLTLARYQSLPYEVGKTLRVRMYVDANIAANIFGQTASRIVDTVPAEYDERRKLEEDVWMKGFLIPKPKIAIPVIPMAAGTFFILIEGGTPLTNDDISNLNAASVMYLLTKIWDHRNRVVLASCFHTEPKSTALTFCTGHNK